MYETVRRFGPHQRAATAQEAVRRPRPWRALWKGNRWKGSG